ncbi:MAG: DUF3810 domain-containing protein [Bacilli bacterium]|nr:DUF3810 domain-containing protein [Bacilli bacterium]
MKIFFKKITDLLKYIFSFKFFRVCSIIFAINIILILIFINKGISSWYVNNVYPLILGSYGRSVSFIPFSLLEIIYLLGIIFGCVLFVSLIIFCFKHKSDNYKKYMKIMAKVSTIALLSALCLNTIIFEPIKNTSSITFAQEKREYTTLEIKKLRDYLFSKTEELHDKIDRDENGAPIYLYDMDKTAIEALHNIEDEFPKLKGYYPKAKPLVASRLFTFFQILGITEFTLMSVNYNKDTSVTFLPNTLTHEYAHIKGYVKEDEANFIAYLSCIKSDDVFFQYSGYLSVIYYVDNDYHVSSKENYVKYSLPEVCYNDADAFSSEAYEALKKNEEISQVLGDISSTVTDTTIKINGDESGIASYSYVVSLLLNYYDGILF